MSSGTAESAFGSTSDRGVRVVWDPGLKAEVARILPGEYYATTGEVIVSTVLGSCVSACIRDPERGIGGMNHFMLPSQSSHSAQEDAAAARYGLAAMEQLINAVLKLGGRRGKLEVKLTGGGRMFANRMDIGQRNAEFALDFVANEGLRLISHDLGGENPRRVLYYPASGRLRVQKMPVIESRRVEAEERQLVDRLREPEAGSVELF
ncbi:MAG: hypothetical protein KC933_10915 [Myxococcales bacterium]|nr:hypothetical protein [Myxococcales bacterium]MCB9645004.1 hypothetical protein [Deltaproteobacteria bacterium]